MQEFLAIFIQRVAETVDTQGRIKTAVANVLEQDQRLVFAYIYGSFARAEAFRDIDVGVYLRDPEEDPFGVSFDVAERVNRYLLEIRSRHREISVLLKENRDEKILPGAGKQRRFRGFHHCDPGLRIAKVNLQSTW